MDLKKGPYKNYKFAQACEKTLLRVVVVCTFKYELEIHIHIRCK